MRGRRWRRECANIAVVCLAAGGRIGEQGEAYALLEVALDESIADGAYMYQLI